MGSQRTFVISGAGGGDFSIYRRRNEISVGRVIVATFQHCRMDYAGCSGIGVTQVYVTLHLKRELLTRDYCDRT